jgi:hypothetical protein
VLVCDKWDAWVHLVSRLMNVHLSDGPDRFKWHLTPTCSFLVKSMYADVMMGIMYFLKEFVENKGSTKN